MLLAATPAEAARFTCPHVGGDFVFGQPANMNSLDQMASTTISGWNFFFTGWGTEPALGPIATMQFFAQPVPTYYPPKGHPDAEVLKPWNAMLDAATDAGRRDAFGNMQNYVLDHVYVLPFGSLTLVQAGRSDVEGFVPYRVRRV